MNPFEHISKLRIFCFMGRRIRFGFAFFVRHHLIYIKAVFLWQALGLHFDRFSEPMHHSLCFCTGYDLRLLMWSSSSQQAQACRWWMGSLKFATGLSLLSYESCRPNAFAFLSSFPLAFQAVSLKRSPFQFQPTLLASSLAGSIEPGFKVSPICLIALERLSFGRTCAFSVSFESGDLGTFVVPYLRRFSFCDYTIPRP